jgi:hypothetical protein
MFDTASPPTPKPLIPEYGIRGYFFRYFKSSAATSIAEILGNCRVADDDADDEQYGYEHYDCHRCDPYDTDYHQPPIPEMEPGFFICCDFKDPERVLRARLSSRGRS